MPLLACLVLTNVDSGLAEETSRLAEPSFGLAAGMGIEQVEALLGPVQEVGPGAYLAAPPAGAAPEIASLGLVLVPSEGLCRVQSTTAPLASDGQGTPIRESFASLLERLWAALGEPRVIDTLREGSTLGKAEQWLEALRAGDRVFLSFWSEDTGARLPAGVEKVVLAARPLEGNQGFVMVEATFFNWPACQALMEQNKP